MQPSFSLPQPGTILSNSQLCEMFRCGNSGGMRRSHRTNTLVLISDHTKSLYEDRWLGDIFYYVGMGKIGDQDINWGQNKTLAESATNGVQVLLFEVHKKNNYSFQGEVYLCDKILKEKQRGEDDKSRNVIVFPLKLKSGTPQSQEIEKEDILFHETLAKLNTTLTANELKSLVENKRPKKGSKRHAGRNYYQRDPFVALYALRRANGVCQLCENEAPFKTKKNFPFLEVHHIEYLSRGGKDVYTNVCALCPNCHRKIHALEDDALLRHLKNKAKVPLKDDHRPI